MMKLRYFIVCVFDEGNQLLEHFTGLLKPLDGYAACRHYCFICAFVVLLVAAVWMWPITVHAHVLRYGIVTYIYV